MIGWIIVLVLHWVVIGGLLWDRSRKPRLISMSEIAPIAAQVANNTGIPYGEALRGLTGLMNHGDRFKH